MKKVFAVASAMLFAVACGPSVPTVATKGVSDSKTATQAVGAVNAALGKALSKISPARQSASAKFKVACDSGSAEATVTATKTGEQSATGTYDISFNACKIGDETISGAIKWSASVGGTEGTIEMNGALAYEGPTFAGNFSFNAFKVSYKATGTGADTKVCVTVTGTFSVGGTTYEVDKSLYGATTAC